VVLTPLADFVLSFSKMIQRQIASERSQATEEDNPRRHRSGFGRGAAELMRELMTMEMLDAKFRRERQIVRIVKPHFKGNGERMDRLNPHIR